MTCDAQTPDLEYALGIVRGKIARALGSVMVHIVDIWTVGDELYVGSFKGHQADGLTRH
jgi:hypothetical protein